MRYFLSLFLLCFILQGHVFPQSATDEKPKLTIAVSEFDPFVIRQQDGSLRGLTIDLFDRILSDNSWKGEYRLMSFKEMLTAVKGGRVDMAASAISITREREQEMDFSMPYYDSGLMIVTPKGASFSFLSFGVISSPRVQITFALFFGFLLLSAVLLWWTERKQEGDISEKFFPGCFEALWLALATVSTVGYGDKAPKKWTGRFVAMIIMFLGIGFYGIIIAEVSSILTVEREGAAISGIEDLKGKTVATKAGTTSQEQLEPGGSMVLAFETIEEAYESLLKGKADAVFYDRPSVLRFAAKHPDFEVVAKVYHPQYYGIALPKNSSLREAVNRSLLRLRESGEWKALQDKYLPEE